MLRLATAFCATLLAAGATEAAIHYGVQDLGAPNFFTAVAPLDVDNSGRVVGAGGFSVPESFLFAGGAITELRGPTGEFAHVKSINGAGTLAGTYTDSAFVPSRAAIWDITGAVTPLALPANTLRAEANALNDADQVVGQAYLTDGTQVAVSWSASGAAAVLPGTATIAATAASIITGNGTIYGSGTADADGDGFPDTAHLLRWINGVAEDLGARDCAVVAATDAGAILCNRPGLPATVLDATGSHPLAMLPGATSNDASDMSAAGVVTGTTFVLDASGLLRNVPTLWIDAQVFALDDLVDPAWEVLIAGAINDNGEIAAWAAPSGGGAPHMLLLTPTNVAAAPATLGLVCGYLLAVFVAARRRTQLRNRVAAR